MNDETGVTGHDAKGKEHPKVMREVAMKLNSLIGEDASGTIYECWLALEGPRMLLGQANNAESVANYNVVRAVSAALNYELGSTQARGQSR